MKTTPPSTEYRNWLRMGIRMFDGRGEDSVLSPTDRVSWMRLDDLEAAADMLDLDRRYVQSLARR